MGMSFTVKQIMRPPRYTRGNTNVLKIQPIDYSAWIWFADNAEDAASDPEKVSKINNSMGEGRACTDSQFSDNPRSFRLRKEFESDGSPLVLDISADERFVLILDGRIVLRGPDRAASIMNWIYHTLEIGGLGKGKHLLEAVAWTHWGRAPLEQLTWRGGFILKAQGTYAPMLDTGVAEWEIGELSGTKLYHGGASCWGCGFCVDSTGTGITYEIPEKWSKAVPVRLSAGLEGRRNYGITTLGWGLYPTRLPFQMERTIAPGVFVGSENAIMGWDDTYSGGNNAPRLQEAFNSLLHGGNGFTVPANTRVSLLWDLQDYYSGYPEMEISGGAGAKIVWGWAESLYHLDGSKRNRSQFKDKAFRGTWDVFRPDGRHGARFSTQWWRCGAWCEIKIETGNEPLDISSLSITESRYPLERECSFETEDPDFAKIEKISTRVLQQCCHETLFDGPFYEQQMYPGDTRVQLLVLSLLSRDRRMIERAIEIFDYGQRDNGMVPMNWPTIYEQDSGTYTLCWLLMFGDYAMRHDNIPWLKARIPAMRKALSSFENMRREDGLVANLPGWSFMDWVEDWPGGVAPSSLDGDEPSLLVNLFYILALESCALAERAAGNASMASVWEETVPALRKRIMELYWDKPRSMLSDSVDHKHFSEHGQCLGVLAGVLTGRYAEEALERSQSEKDPAFCRCSVYFCHYLFDAFFKMGRADFFFERFRLWRDYLSLGLHTTIECPENGEQVHKVSRSDCHAWGAHPIYWMHTGLLGIRPAAFGYGKVSIAPNPGPLKSIKAKTPVKDDFIFSDLAFDGDAVKGKITLPSWLDGEFSYCGRSVRLVPGENII